jgi:formylglycine-generating enzyme required for sulfatase activity
MKRRWIMTGLLTALLGVGLSSPTLAASASPGMIRIPGGTYTPFYALKKGPVSLPAFELDAYPVSNADYLNFVRQHPRWRRAQVAPIFADSQYLLHWPDPLRILPEQARQPVNYVSWFAARAYCQAQGKKLPTQDQWEFVARASESEADASANPRFRQRILDWYARPTPRQLGQLGSTYRNVYGVYDMHGLLWEWVRDFNTVMVTGESREDSSLDRNLFCAGGALDGADPSYYASYMRYAFRSSLKGHYALKNLGFRCAKEVTP